MSAPPSPSGSLSGFARFYAPLAVTSLLLTSTNPILAAALARSVDPATALAGYSVAFALCGVLYSPLLVAQQVAATRLLEGGDLSPVRRFVEVMGTLFSLIALAVAFTPLGAWVFRDLIGVTGGVYLEARDAMTLLWAVPLLTGIRAIHQGRLVAGHRTHPIALATGSRTGVLVVAAFGLTLVSSGAWIGAAAFTLGLMVEAVVVGSVPSAEISESRAVGPQLIESTGDRLIRFVAPLMLNVLLWWSTPLIIQAALARTPEPETALASFAVVEAVAWFVTAPVGQYQHASIALVSDRASHGRIRRWAGGLAVLVALTLALLAVPWVRSAVLRWAFDLEPGLLEGVGRALPLAAAYPLLYGHRQYYQGLFIRANQPGVVGSGAVLRVGFIAAVAVLSVGPLGGLGATLGVGLAVLGLMVEGLFLERLSHSRALPALGAPSTLPGEAVTT